MMDLSRFLGRYSVDANLEAPVVAPMRQTGGRPPGTMPGEVAELLETIGGMSFSGGLYRLHRLEDIASWNETLATAWSDTRGRVTCFAYDWLGRQFALFEKAMILQFSAGVLEWVEIPADIKTFHNEILLDLAEPALAVNFYNAWLESGGKPPRYSECVGYKRPLFLGGDDWVENLEVIDMDVYWTVTAPMIAKARRVGVGGLIGKIEIGE